MISDFAKELVRQLYRKPFEKVEVAGLGTFQIVRIPPRKLLHKFSWGREADKRIVQAEGYYKLKFTQSPDLKKKLTEKYG